MKKKEVLEKIEFWIGVSVLEEDFKALMIAKEAVAREWRYRFLSSLVLAITAIIIFGSFVAMAYIMY